MPLRLAIENEKQLPDGGPLTIAVSTGGGIEIGRAQYLDWVLPDANKVVSNKHCEVRWNEDGFYLTDTSTNGTYLNGSEDRLQATAKLKHGDRISIGHYIVAVSLQEEGRPSPPPGVAQPPSQATGLDDLWSDAAAAPPISADLLRPPPKVSGNDFLNRVADLPWNGPPPAAPPARLARDAADDDDWLPRGTLAAAPESVAPSTAPAYAEAPFQRPVREEAGVAWTEPPSVPVRAEVVAEPLPQGADWSDPSPAAAWPVAESLQAPPPADDTREHPRAPAAPVRASPPPETEGRPARWQEPSAAPPPSRPPDDFLAHFAKGAGLPVAALTGRDGGELAEELGGLMRTIATELKRLLDARQQAKRALRVSHHTEIAAFDNNPLKYQPSVENALAMMLGPPNRSYMGAQACIEASLKDVAEHQLLTFSAMQKAVQMLEKEFDPATIEKEVEHDRGLAARVGFRHSKLWDAYVHRWANRTKYQGDGLTGAFLKDFAKCYDELEASGS